MKIYLFIIVTFVGLASCNSIGAKKKNIELFAGQDTSKFTTIKWIDSLKDLGIINAGKKVEIKFRFKNTGDKPLYVIAAQPGCGCTVADYPKKAIAPGGQGLITADYDVHADSRGDFRKYIHVTTNTKPNTNHSIYFYGTIRNAADSATIRKEVSAAHIPFKNK
jgi:hypothetical protein